MMSHKNWDCITYGLESWFTEFASSSMSILQDVSTRCFFHDKKGRLDEVQRNLTMGSFINFRKQFLQSGSIWYQKR